MNPNQYQVPGSQYSQKGTYIAPPAQPSVVAPTQPPAQLPVYPQQSSGVGKIIAIVILTLTTIASLGLLAYVYTEFVAARTDVDGQIATAVAEAQLAQAEELEKKFAEEEKKPNRTFSAPEDYGNLSFQFPKTWSVYIDSDISSGTKDYIAYLHPGEVPAYPSSDATITAITITIKDTTVDKVTAAYDKLLEKGNMTAETVKVNKGTYSATLYRGTVKKSFIGMIAIMKIRDKVAIIQTDSSSAYEEDFMRILNSLTFNA